MDNNVDVFHVFPYLCVMNWIKRWYEEEPDNFLKKGKVIVLYGPRRVGKTLLINKILNSANAKIFIGNGEDIDLADILKSKKTETYRLFFSQYDIIFIDEAQYIENVGLYLKMLVDLMPEKIFIVTGSSSFNISGVIAEPLTGRNVCRTLFPISLLELKKQANNTDIISKIEEYLIFGMYPEVFSFNSINEKIEYLINLRNSYLFKDILALENIRNSSRITDILKLLAFQAGSEISINEISRKIGIAKATIEKYLDLLEKAFVIKRIGSFSRNLRNEIAKSAKYYFYDNGIRNALINNFNSLKDRDDIDKLWENFVVMEMIKKQEYLRQYSNNYFWRTYYKKEIDFVEERQGKLFGYTIKWTSDKTKAPSLWLETYKEASFEIITKENFLNLLDKL